MIAILFIGVSTSTYSQDQNRDRDRLHHPDRNQQIDRERIHAAKTEKERNEIRQQHKEEMRTRALNKGIDAPEK